MSYMMKIMTDFTLGEFDEKYGCDCNAKDGKTPKSLHFDEWRNLIVT